MGTQITYVDVEYNGAKKNISVLNFLTAGSLMLDTTQYTMPTTGGTYQIGLTITDSKGNKLAGSEIQELLDAGRLKYRIPAPALLLICSQWKTAISR